jgi:hypothetical protein
MMGERFCLNTNSIINDRAVIEQKPIIFGWWMVDVEDQPIMGIYGA